MPSAVTSPWRTPQKFSSWRTSTAQISWKLRQWISSTITLRTCWRRRGGSQWWCHIPTWWLRRTALWLQHSALFWDPHVSAWSSLKILPVVRLRLFSRSSSHCCCHWLPGRQRNLWSFYSAVGGKDCIMAQTFKTALNELGGIGGREGPGTRGCST